MISVGLALVLAGCPTAAPSLLVQLRSDYIAGIDIDEAVVRLRLSTVPVGAPIETELAFGAALGRGVRLALLGDLATGTYDVDLELRRGGVIVAHTSRLVRVVGSTVTTFLVTRDCETLDCGEEICVAGQCAPRTCTEDAREDCPSTCNAAAMCAPSAVACVFTECTAGVCFAAPDSARCATGEVCDAARGCISIPGPSAPVVFFPWNGYATGSAHAAIARSRRSTGARRAARSRCGSATRCSTIRWLSIPTIEGRSSRSRTSSGAAS